MNRRRRFSTAQVQSVALGLFLALLPRSSGADGVATVRTQRAQPKAFDGVPKPLLQRPAEEIPALRLPAVEGSTLEAASSRRRKDRPGSQPLQVGVVRELSTELAGRDTGAWFEAAGGLGDRHTWALRLESAGAIFLRARLRGVVPVNSSLWVRNASGAVVARYDGGTRLEGVWTPTVAGDSLRLELDAPVGDPPPPSLRVNGLVHGFRGLSGIGGIGDSAEAAGTCHNDATCFPEWAATAAGVALYLFVEEDAVLVCTGQLLNNKKNDLTPFFLTAHHCISDGNTAASAEFFWFYQSDTCGGSVPALADVPRSSGAGLIATGAATDFTLLEVLGTLPPGVSWLGWTSKPVPNGTPAVAIHHPTGDFRRLSFGTKAAGAGEACVGVNDSTHVRINWTDGPTEGGSSGSGIYRQDNGQLFGQLHCGSSSCGNETNDSYGGFFKTFKSIKAPLSNGGSDDKSENNDSCKTARTIAKGTLAGRVVKAKDSDWYRFSVPAGKSVTIDLSFLHARGDLDLDVFVACNTDPFGTSHGQGDAETFSVTNVSSKPAILIWRVYLATDTRNTYDQIVTVF